MRIDRINLGVDTDENGMVRSASVYFENVSEIGERISGNFGITVEQYNKVQNKELTIREIAEAKVIELFQIKPNQDAMAGVVELRKQLESKDKELQTQTEMILELTLMLSQMSVTELESELDEVEENDEIDTIENPDIEDNSDNTEGGEGGE